MASLLFSVPVVPAAPAVVAVALAVVAVVVVVVVAVVFFVVVSDLHCCLSVYDGSVSGRPTSANAALMLVVRRKR